MQGSPSAWLYYNLFFLLFLTTARHNGFLLLIKLYYKKPPLLPSSQDKVEGVGGLLLIMPVMTAPANHTHYSAWTGTLIIARFYLSIRATKLQYEHQT